MYRNTKLAQRARSRRRTLVIGAGDAASTLLHEVFKSNNRDMNVVCCVDDAPEKVGRRIMGVEIMGTTEDIPELVERCDIETILLAIPTLDEAGKRRILRICNKTKCNVRILPDIVKLISRGKTCSPACAMCAWKTCWPRRNRIIELFQRTCQQ